jgi:glycosyltransferase involved in cell wall biosynthesis
LKTLRIAYISETSVQDRHAWSGTVYYAHKALKDFGHDMIPLGPLRPKWIRYYCMALNQLSLFFLKKRFDYRHSTIYTKAFGKLFTKALKQHEFDCIVVCGGTEYAAYLQSNKPIFIILDRTIQGAINYHSILSNLLPASKEQSIASDKKAMQQAAKIIFSSQWAADHAINMYHLSSQKIRVMPFGANMDALPSADFVFKHKKVSDVCNLLLIGTMWKNKGADIAINALNILIQNNIKVHLTIVGCTPETPIDNPNVSIIPFLNKNEANGLKKIEELFLSHSFFILPTRFDCTPIVFCEASAFALPILSADTGGVAGHIEPGKNGFLIPYDDKGELYAAKIIELWNNKTEYSRLQQSTRAKYDASLNWKVWASEFTKTISDATI